MRNIILLLFISTSIYGQQFMSKKGEIRFFSEAPIENIQAVNNQAMGIIDLKQGEFAFKVSIADFVFPNSLMQEHFNESYLESDKYPYSTFTGKIEPLININQENIIDVVGSLTIHGIQKAVKLQSSIQQTGDDIQISSEFEVVLNDFDIDIPKIMMYKIAEVIQVTVTMNLQKIDNE